MQEIIKAAQDQANADTHSEAAQVTQSAGFITIVEDPRDGSWPWQYVDPDTGRKFDTVFHLRQIPDDVNKVFREKHTRKEWKNGQLRTHVDGDAYGTDLIDYAVVDWDGAYAVRKDDKGQPTRVAIECARKYKVLLPEKVQGEIIRLCLGKELAAAVLGG